MTYRSPYPHHEIRRAGGYLRHLMSRKTGTPMEKMRKKTGISNNSTPLRKHNNQWQRSALNCNDQMMDIVNQHNLSYRSQEEVDQRRVMDTSGHSSYPNSTPQGDVFQPGRDAISTNQLNLSSQIQKELDIKPEAVMFTSYHSSVSSRPSEENNIKQERETTSNQLKVNSHSQGKSNVKTEVVLNTCDQSNVDNQPNERINIKQERVPETYSPSMKFSDNQAESRYYRLLQNYQNQSASQIKNSSYISQSQKGDIDSSASLDLNTIKQENVSNQIRTDQQQHNDSVVIPRKRSFPSSPATETCQHAIQNRVTHENNIDKSLTVKSEETGEPAAKKQKQEYKALKCDFCDFMINTNAGKKPARKLMQTHFVQHKHRSSSLVMVEKNEEDISTVSHVLLKSVCDSSVTFRFGDADTGDVIPMCPRPGCDYIYNSVWLCAKHYQYFHDESVTNFYGLGKIKKTKIVKIPTAKICEACGKSFPNLPNLVKHWETKNHNPYRIPKAPVICIFSCTYCNEIFWDFCKCRTHTIDKHQPQEPYIDVLVTNISPPQAPLYLPPASPIANESQVNKEKFLLMSVRNSRKWWKKGAGKNGGLPPSSIPGVKKKLAEEIKSMKNLKTSILMEKEETLN